MAGNRTQCSLRPRLKFLARLLNFTSGLEGKITKFSKTYILHKKKYAETFTIAGGQGRVLEGSANKCK